MREPERDSEATVELLEVLDLLLAYADRAALLGAGRSLDLRDLRARLEGLPTFEDKVDAVEAALDQLDLL